MPPEAPPRPVEKSPEPVAGAPAEAPGGATGSALRAAHPAPARADAGTTRPAPRRSGRSRGAAGRRAGGRCERADAARRQGGSFKPFGPYKPIEKGGSGGLTAGQRRYVDDFVDRYTRRTAESKRLTQDAAPQFADPRVVAGFRSDWKEIVYPIVADRSSGSKLWDVDGNEYVDLSWASA